MIFQVECEDCYGHGRIHSDGHTGDPMDVGWICETCDGLGVVDVDEFGNEL